jgi:hypothetical protein
MYISIEQIRSSLEHLHDIHPFFGMSFLAFKKERLPVGKTTQVIFSRIASALLLSRYKASATYDGFYNPFQSSKGGESDAWVKPRYPSTSLQRITTDTFADAFIHPKGSSEWGWKSDYVARLKAHVDSAHLIPTVHLAIWIYRDESLTDGSSPKDLYDRLLREFFITTEERDALFDPSVSVTESWSSKTRPSERDLLNVIGRPPGHKPDSGAALNMLELCEIGPTRLMRYEPMSRLNLITGDNALGKTFLLECAFWALTGEWAGSQALPREDAEDDAPRIAFNIGADGTSGESIHSKYIRDNQGWSYPTSRSAQPGVVIYARFDGSFAIWDSARIRSPRTVRLSALEVWNGLPPPNVINGFLTDWISWSRGGDRFAVVRKGLDACVKALSPDPDKPLRFGEPRVLPDDSRDIPTLDMPYGEVPITYASAGIKRIIAIAYVLVWAWDLHVRTSSTLRKNPEPRLIVLIDEVEAHLHPRWQRRIVPAVLAALEGVVTEAIPQIHVATHSPLVMASSEVVFKVDRDALHHITLSEDDSVVLEALDFHKEGRIDRWLSSDVFGLGSPRSVEAEQAIASANTLQAQTGPVDPALVLSVHERLGEVLGSDDDYWVRWISFARRNGVKT